MKRQKMALTIIALLAALAVGCSNFTAKSTEQKPASATDYAKPSVDLSGIEAPKDAPPEKYSFSLQAAGTQTYSCGLNKDGNPVWSGRPDADLYENGVKVGRHSGTLAGPFWETLDGSSRVTGTPDATKRIPKVAPGSPDTIDWLWVPAVQQSGDKFGKVISIQRVSTVGGSKKFSGACDLNKDSKPVPVFYSATYYFNIAR